MKKTMLLLPLLLLAMMVHSESIVRVVVANGSESSFAADNVRKLVLSPSSVDVISSEGILLQSVPLAGILRVEFGEGTPLPTGIDETPFPSTETPRPATKIIRDGQLFILHNGTLYNMQGYVIGKLFKSI